MEGRPIPVVHEMQRRSFYAAQGPRKAGMAVTAEGTILRLIGGYLSRVKYNMAALDTQGGTLGGRYEGPALLPLRRGRFTRRPFLAVSSDGKWAYISGLADFRPDVKDKTKRNVSFAAVYRVTLPERTPCEPFFGEPEKAGDDKGHLGGAPHGVAATDRYVYTGDSINRRMLRLRIAYAAEETCVLP